MKKFSIGLSLINCNKKEWIKIINKYCDSISYIYYSPNSKGFFSRGFDEKISKIDEKEQYEILNYARLKGIKTELAINTRKDFEEKYLKNFLIKEKEKHNPDYVVTYNHYIDLISDIFTESEFTLSYNEGIFKIEDLNKINKKFNTIILGNRWIRNKDIFKETKKLGFKTELLVNNGCSHNCTYCFSKGNNCEFFFNMNLSNFHINVITAINTIFPFEIYEQYEKWNLIDNYKLSTRPQNYHQINFLLNSFVENKNIDVIMKDHDKFYSLLNLSYYIKFIPFMNLNEIYKIKNKEWKIINNN